MSVRDLFAPVVANNPHIAFERLLGSSFHSSARTFMNDIFARMGDIDGNFIQDFQGPGFHSRLFELACFAYLDEHGYQREYGHSAPDFIVSTPRGKIAIEAVTSNPTSGRHEDISLMALREESHEEIFEKYNEEFPIRVGNSLLKKVRKRYPNKPHCQGLPFVLAIAPFHEPGSVTYIDEALARYLYGIERYPDWIERNGLLVREAPVYEHSFGNRTIRSNFFDNDEVADISAILWCNQFTVPRFTRLAWQKFGLPREVTSTSVSGFYATEDEHGAGTFEYSLCEEPSPPAETWARGVTILHNPNASIPLLDGVLRCTSTFRVQQGRLKREVSDFHPLTCFMYCQVDSQ